MIWPFAKLRYGRAFIGEKVYIKDGFHPGAKVLAEGRIVDIEFNLFKVLATPWPAEITKLGIKWKYNKYNGLSRSTELADLYVRCQEGDGPPHAGIWRTV